MRAFRNVVAEVSSELVLYTADRDCGEVVAITAVTGATCFFTACDLTTADFFSVDALGGASGDISNTSVLDDVVATGAD